LNRWDFNLISVEQRRPEDGGEWRAVQLAGQLESGAQQMTEFTFHFSSGPQT